VKKITKTKIIITTFHYTLQKTLTTKEENSINKHRKETLKSPQTNIL
jgi:hypothetical protein